MNKKGSDPNYTWPELVLGGILVFGIMFGTIMKIANPHKINQEYVAKDTATIIDTLYGTPLSSQVGMHYPHAFGQYHLVAKDNLVQVGSVGEKISEMTARYPYSDHQYYRMLNSDFVFLRLDFFKERSGVSFTMSGSGVVLGLLPVEDVDTKADLDGVRIFVVESPEAKPVGDLLRTILSAESRGSRTASLDDAEVIVYLAKGDADVLKVYFSDSDVSVMRRSRKLATLIHNEFWWKGGVFSSLEIARPETYEGDFAVLRKVLPVVYVELGTLSGDASVYAEGLSVALRRYFA